MYQDEIILSANNSKTEFLSENDFILSADSKTVFESSRRALWWLYYHKCIALPFAGIFVIGLVITTLATAPLLALPVLGIGIRYIWKSYQLQRYEKIDSEGIHLASQGGILVIPYSCITSFYQSCHYMGKPFLTFRYLDGNREKKMHCTISYPRTDFLLDLLLFWMNFVPILSILENILNYRKVFDSEQALFIKKQLRKQKHIADFPSKWRVAIIRLAIVGTVALLVASFGFASL